MSVVVQRLPGSSEAAGREEDQFGPAVPGEIPFVETEPALPPLAAEVRVALCQLWAAARDARAQARAATERAEREARVEPEVERQAAALRRFLLD
ncbi:MAG: hypothetical protein HY690_11310 [Chloroflexi bacterium]|nr:hypothetical protein [Chloroflexota bacterium]